MARKLGLILCLTILPIVFTLTTKIQIVKAFETIYIRANGSIDPPTAPILNLNNITYTLTGNLNDSLVVERNNIVIDGAGHIIGGSNVYKSKGINIEERVNVTIKNIWICNFYYGIYLSKSSGNQIRDSNITENTHGVDFCGNSWYNVVVRNNVINNSRGIYLFGGSSHNKVSENIITNNIVGIEFDQSSDNIISENSIANNNRGLYVYSNSYNNIIVNNNITENSLYGLHIYWSSYNSIFHNNFLNNTIQVQVDSSLDQNYWNNDVEGNYWSDYTDLDLNYDGIGDEWYEINSNNIDHYPLMGMYSSFTSYGYTVSFISNSSISGFSFNLSPIEVYPPEAILVFNVSGVKCTKGFVRLCVPKILINGSYVVRFDGEIITETTYPQVQELPCSNETYTYFYINYTHCKHTIEINGITTIPENSPSLITPLFLLAIIVAIKIYKRNIICKKM